MTKEQLIQAMSLFGFQETIDYTIDQDYASIAMIAPEAIKPSEESLQTAYDNWQYQSTLPARIQALGDIAILIGQYFQDNSSLMHNGDSWNPAGFDVDKFDSNWGWNFQELPKPTIDQLEAIKASLQ